MTAYGVVTRNEEEVSWDAFDMGFYEMKDVTGRAAEPLSNAVNMISCFGDNAAVDAEPSLAARTADGTLATREQPYFDWAYVCPTHDDYRRGVLEMIDDAAAANDDVRLDDIGFPRPEYCRCDRCDAAFDAWADGEAAADADRAATDTATDEAGDTATRSLAAGAEWFTETPELSSDRAAWRASVVTEFVARATDRIPGRTYLTLYPDPYPGSVYERAGLDLTALAPHVDEFVVPLYDTAYETTYWLETIAKGFERLLAELPVSFAIELYAVQVGVDELIHATEVASAYADRVFFGYDASNAAAALRRMRAEDREGVEHGTPEE